jgi:hypothetical protein
MGIQTIFDLIGSSMVFGSLFLITLRLNYSTSENLQDYRGDLIVQENLVAVTQLLEFDFRKIGYCKDYTKIPSATLAIRYADTSDITFWTDMAVSSSNLAGDGNLDSIRYFVSSTNELSATPNPNDRLLYRGTNDQTPIGVNMGVTIFKIQYYDAFRNKLATPVADPREIQYLEISIQVEHPVKWTKYYNTATYDTVYQTAFWKQVRLVAKNFNNR